MKLFEKKQGQPPKAKKEVPAGKNAELFRSVCAWVYKLRSVFLAVPVVLAAVIMAIYNSVHLPESVNLCVPSFANDAVSVSILEISKGFAIFGPLLITTLCLVMVFCSRRVVYPWLISLFSLVLPLFIYFASVFPG